MSCKKCNFRGTPECVVEQIWQQYEDDEITEEMANDLSQSAYEKCEDQYYDYLIDFNGR